MGVSHSHCFTVFPSRMPRNTIPDSVKAELERMVAEKHPCSAIRMRTNLLCNNDVFQNAVRGAHRRMNSEQTRALRDAASKSGVWSSAVHLAEDKCFRRRSFQRSCCGKARRSGHRLRRRHSVLERLHAPRRCHAGEGCVEQHTQLHGASFGTGRSRHLRGSSGSWLGSFPRRRSCAIGATHRALH